MCPKKIPSKAELLYKIFEAQSQAFTARVEAEVAQNDGDLVTAIAAHQNHIMWGMRQLEASLLHNAHHPAPVEIPGTVQTVISSMLIRADLLQSLGSVDEANREREKAVQLSDAHLPTSGKLQTKRSLASAFTSQGRFNEALVALEECRDWLSDQRDLVPLIRVTIDMVDILNWLGDQSKALDLLNRADGLLQEAVEDQGLNKMNFGEAFRLLTKNFHSGGGLDGKKISDGADLFRASLEIDFYRALIYKGMERYHEAEQLFLKVKPGYETLGLGLGVDFHLAALLAARGNFEEALALYGKIEPLFKDQMVRPKLSSLLKLKAEALHHLGDSEQALKNLDGAIEDLSSTYYDPDLLWRIFMAKGRILNETGKQRAALDAFLQGADVVNRLRRAPLGYRLDSTYLKDKIPLFREAIALATALDSGEECCKLMEMVKSRILTATLSFAHHEAASDELDKLRRRVDHLATELDALEYKAAHAEAAGEIRERAEAILKERDELLQRIRFSDPRWRSVTEPVPFDLDQIKELARSRETSLLSMFYGENSIDCVLISGDGCVTGNVVLAEQVKESLQAYLKSLSNDSGVNVLNDPYEVALGAKHLVPEKLLEKGLQSRRLIFVPHGPLHLLPWAGLVYKQKRLFEYCPVSILPNLSTFLTLSRSPLPKSKIAIMGPPDYAGLGGFSPLPGAAQECQEIKGLYPESCVIGEVALGKGSTQGAFWDLAKHPDSAGSILHVACHGVSDPLEPMHSGLMLADGRLDASEIALNSLQFSEVILSGCSTGWRPVDVQDIELAGDDILGLPGALLETGASSVLVSIPPADDVACSKFMVRYHAHRSRGVSSMQSLQTTQKEMLADPRFQPFQWIGMTLYGCH